MILIILIIWHSTIFRGNFYISNSKVSWKFHIHGFKIISGMVKKDSWKCMHRVQKFRRMGKKDSWKTLYLTFYFRWNSYRIQNFRGMGWKDSWKRLYIGFEGFVEFSTKDCLSPFNIDNYMEKVINLCPFLSNLAIVHQ